MGNHMKLEKKTTTASFTFKNHPKRKKPITANRPTTIKAGQRGRIRATSLAHSSLLLLLLLLLLLTLLFLSSVAKIMARMRERERGDEEDEEAEGEE